jgi:co-chaperonin GroES (HSP10)
MSFMKVLCAILAATGLLSAADLTLGKPLTLKEPVSLATLLAKPADYVGKSVQVQGKIVEVCQMMGCWLDLTNNDGQKIRVKVEDGDIVFPKDSSGKTVVAEGVFSKLELTREQAVAQAEEEAREKGRTFDPASVKSGMTIYQIQGTGAIIRSN